jgi:hypothetical protein
MIEIKSLIAIGFGGILLVYSLFLVGVNQSESDELRKKFEKAKSRYFKLLVANHELKQKIKVLESRLNDLGAKYSELNRQYEVLKENYVEVLRNSNSDGMQIMDNGDFKLRVESGEKDDWIKYRHVVQELINRTNARYKLPYNLDVVVRYCGVGVTYAAYAPYYLDGRHLGVVLCAENLNRTANIADLYVKYHDESMWREDVFRLLVALVYYHEVGHVMIYLAGIVKGSGEEMMADDFALWNIVKDGEDIKALRKIVYIVYGNNKQNVTGHDIDCILRGILEESKRYEGDRCAVMWYELNKTWSNGLKAWLK